MSIFTAMTYRSLFKKRFQSRPSLIPIFGNIYDFIFLNDKKTILYKKSFMTDAEERVNYQEHQDGLSKYLGSVRSTKNSQGGISTPQLYTNFGRSSNMKNI